MRLPALFRRNRSKALTGGTSDFGGFTMVEVLTVAVVIGTLVRIALPNFHEVLLKARAAEVMGDFEVVRLAVLNYHADHLEWPEDAYVGQNTGGLQEC